MNYSVIFATSIMALSLAACASDKPRKSKLSNEKTAILEEEQQVKDPATFTGCEGNASCFVQGKRVSDQQFYDPATGLYFFIDEKTGEEYWANGTPRAADKI